MSDARTEFLLSTLRLAPVVPVITVDHPAQAVEMATALVAGGLPVLEVTLRTDSALEAIEAMARHVPGAVVGAGTVLTPSQVSEAASAGARFLVSPGATTKLAEAAARGPAPLLPGVATASEAMAMAEMGHHVLKFFPAEAAGGVAYLKSLAAPLPHLTFCPTGGIDAAKARAYLALPNVACVGGSWVLPAAAVKAGDWATVTRLSREAAGLRG
ncbi:bifunctional 4-hydroxy-2-oxoglutarate aldolase/2-dehydro-3-deoxy-phosphogluconate aldolase [Alsobacter sp. SYSU M60028]|uniref:2-dehydro-3-deoxy-phosphogluconate aldolase n=1 Tax=Alsobacter ponti TaxID=2962936 RepID=A0ABT1LF56_9HYPH|nr:bifunctional 4-hydroxy-2-oxoglutarate aldolase/2-dehydro-3-deoxy-phosphogluconate aldolase [Alsobacter ponti]MCP8939591.1 bifunctional 4-hydroxy-2-oxoglutarate aldolase/2-dehydro-3-deoxy-phosphogluconate aldolase [Alsobacter ponti]